MRGHVGVACDCHDLMSLPSSRGNLVVVSVSGFSHSVRSMSRTRADVALTGRVLYQSC